MTAPVDRWKLGLFVLGGFAAVVGGLTFAGMAQLQRPSQEAFAYFDEPLVGLEPGSSVRFRGVPIGVVDDITLASDKKHLQVRMALYDDKLAKLGLDVDQLGPQQAFPADLRAQLVTQYITQMSFVLVDFVDPAATKDRDLPFQHPINTIRTIPSAFRSFEEGLRDVMREVPAIADSARRMFDGVQKGFADANLGELQKRLDSTLRIAEQRLLDLDKMPALQSATSAFTEFDAILREWRAKDGPVHTVAADLKALASDLRAAIAAADVQATAQSLRAAGDGAASASVEVSALARDIRKELESLRSALSAIERLADVLERDPGALLRGRQPASSPLRKE
jgi:paraquat-inducible protein B